MKNSTKLPIEMRLPKVLKPYYEKSNKPFPKVNNADPKIMRKMLKLIGEGQRIREAYESKSK